MERKRIVTLMLAGVVAAGTALTGCGSLNMEETVATVNGTPISLGLANFAAQFTAVNYDTYYMSYFGADMWTSDQSGNGETMTKTVKDNTLDSLEEYYLLEQHMEDYGISVTDEELAKAEAAAAQFAEDNTDEALKALCANNQDYVKEFLRLHLIQSKMEAAIVADVDRDVPDEDCAQKTFSYVRVSKTADVSSEDASDSSAEEETEEKTEEQKAAEAEKKAQEILDAALTGSQEDPLQAAADDKDASVSTCSYGASDLDEEENSTSMEPEVLQAAEKLKEGEFAKRLIETDSYFYVLRMDSLFDQDATDKKRASIISGREDELYESTVNGYKEAAEWVVDEKVWEPVNFDTIYSKVQTNTDGDKADAADETQDDSDGTDESADDQTNINDSEVE